MRYFEGKNLKTQNSHFMKKKLQKTSTKLGISRFDIIQLPSNSKTIPVQGQV